jgi:F-type H+-transporting ATPase subunit b
MPAFFEAEFWKLSNPELWVAIGLLIFIAILWKAGAFKLVLGGLDEKAAKIQANLDEAARIRDEAQALLADISRQRVEADAHAKALIEAAEDTARRMTAEAKVRLEETIVLRTRLAERKIEVAQAEAAAQVKAAAIDLAASAAARVMADQLAASKSDPLIDKAIGQLAGKLQ